MTSTKPPGGTRDFLPDEIRRREYVIGIIRTVYERYGFEPLETPAFENIETLLGKYGEEGNRLIFKILRRGEHEGTGEADLALRYDLTVPLARVVAQYQNELPRLFKRYQIQPVWRADRPARGRFREFYQCDIDAMGSTSPTVEAELLAAVTDVLTALGFGDFVVRLNHRAILGAVLKGAGVPEALSSDALTALDKLDKIGPSGVEEELTRRAIPHDAAVRLLEFLRRTTGDRESGPHLGDWEGDPSRHVLEQTKAFVSETPAGAAAVLQLEEIVALARSTVAAGRIRVDPSLARGLSYYTGAIMEITVLDLPGSLGGGGRYDNLVGMFLGRDVPACGFSLGLERMIVVMTEREMFPSAVSRAAVDVMIAFMDDSLRGDALRLAAEFRAEALRVDVFPEAGRKLDKPLKYASGRNVPFMAILGEDERAKGEVAVRDMQTRQQENLPRSAAAGWIAERVRPRDSTPRT